MDKQVIEISAEGDSHTDKVGFLEGLGCYLLWGVMPLYWKLLSAVPALEVLAIVAYFQPVTRAYVDQVRGVDSAYTVTTLLERGLIESCGKLDAPGRPSLYRTSALFLRTMGMQSLDELPVLPDLSSNEGAEKLEQAISERRGRGEQMELTDTEEKPTGE